MRGQGRGLGFWSQSWLVLLLSLSFGGALAAVEISLQPRIKANKRNLTLSKIPELVPGAVIETSTESQLGGATVFAAVDADGRQVGWVVPATGQGFADRIELLLGVNTDASVITGIFVLAQKETPALGDLITSHERFRRYFVGQPSDPPLRVVKREPEPGNGEIRGLTGATISSESVADAVNRKVAEIAGALAATDEGTDHDEQ